MTEATHKVIAKHKAEIEKAAVFLFNITPEMGPLFHVVDDANKTHLIQPRTWNPDNKDNTVDWIRDFARKKNAILVASIAEAWFSTFPKETPWSETSLPPSQDPDRKECLIIAFDTILGSTSIMYEIDRTDGARKLINRVETQNSGGRFSNLVSRKVN